jgi:hypothetical protein
MVEMRLMPILVGWLSDLNEIICEEHESIIPQVMLAMAVTAF